MVRQQSVYGQYVVSVCSEHGQDWTRLQSGNGQQLIRRGKEKITGALPGPASCELVFCGQKKIPHSCLASEGLKLGACWLHQLLHFPNLNFADSYDVVW